MVDITSGQTSGRAAAWRLPAALHGVIALALGRLEAEQDRWFLWVPVLFGCGVGLYFALAAEPHLLAVLAPLGMALALTSVWRTGVLAVVVGSALLAVLLGFAAAKLRSEWVSAPILERTLTRVTVAGFVERVEPRVPRGERLTILVTALGDLAPSARPRRVRIRVPAPATPTVPGTAIRLVATLSPPAAPSLPGDYDFARSAWFQSIGAVGFSRTRPVVDPTAGPAPPALRAMAAIEAVRQAIAGRVTAALPGEQGAIATALITGERGGISEATNAAFRDSGLYHILSISGLHMAIMAGAMFYVLRLALAAFPAVALTQPIKKWAAAGAMVASLGYLLISGSAFATVRSWVMISIMFLAIMLDRPAIALRNVALAALAILLVFPDSLLDAGFQMSFAAVVALVAAYELIRARLDRTERQGRRGPVRGLALFFAGIVLSTLIASIAVAPLAAYHFHKSQHFAILGNLIAIPVCNVVIMPAALATLVMMPFGLEALPLWVMGLGIDAMVWCARAVARLPGAVGHVPAMPHAAFLLMIAGGLWLCLWRTRWRLAGLAAIAAGVGLAPFADRPDILVGRDGQLVAARLGSPARLQALPAPSAHFELARWLEHDGDGRKPREASRGEGFVCDAIGCTATVKGALLAIARHPAALVDDCARARILVLTFARPETCRVAGSAIDLFAVRAAGTHALYLDGGSIRIATVAETRGNRPWSRTATRWQTREVARAPHGSRLEGFAAPFDLEEAALPPRPEIEDDEAADIDAR